MVADLSSRRVGFYTRSVRLGFVVDRVALGQISSPRTSVFPWQYHSTSATYQKDKRSKPGNLPKNQRSLGNLAILGRNVEGKAVSLQAWSGPEGSRKLRFPDFITTAQDGGKVVSLTHRPSLPKEINLILISVRG